MQNFKKCDLKWSLGKFQNFVLEKTEKSKLELNLQICKKYWNKFVWTESFKIFDKLQILKFMFMQIQINIFNNPCILNIFNGKIYAEGFPSFHHLLNYILKMPACQCWHFFYRKIVRKLLWHNFWKYPNNKLLILLKYKNYVIKH